MWLILAVVVNCLRQPQALALYCCRVCKPSLSSLKAVSYLSATFPLPPWLPFITGWRSVPANLVPEVPSTPRVSLPDASLSSNDFCGSKPSATAVPSSSSLHLASKQALLLDCFPIHIARAAAKYDTQVPHRVVSAAKKAKSCERLARVAATVPWIAAETLRQVEMISVDFFGENIPQRRGCGLSLLVHPRLRSILEQHETEWAMNQAASPESQQQNEREAVRVLAIASYCANPSVAAMEIAKVGVRREFQRMGFGRRLVNSVVKKARNTGGVRFTTLSSLPESVSFYKRIGFADEGSMDKVLSAEVAASLQPGQVHMEIDLRSRRAKPRARRDIGKALRDAS